MSEVGMFVIHYGAVRTTPAGATFSDFQYQELKLTILRVSVLGISNRC
jgi:hypothetical protein